MTVTLTRIQKPVPWLTNNDKLILHQLIGKLLFIIFYSVIFFCALELKKKN